MANIKITDLVALTDPASTDVLPIVDVGADATKKISIADLLENAGSGTAAAPGIAFDGDSDTGIYSPGADQVAISTNGTGRLFVNSSGNVGIGTTSPSSLDPGANNLVVGSGSGAEGITIYTGNASRGIINFADGTTGVQTYVGQVAYDHSANALTFGTSAAERARITADGKLGLGTSSPATTLDVNGNVTITDKIIHGGDTNTAIRFPAADTFAVETAGTERLRVDSSGNVGIGTTTVSAGLHVVTDVNPVLSLDRGTANNTNANLYYNGTLTGQLAAANADFQISAAGASTPMSFYVNGSQRAAIDTSGRLLVGTSSNSGGALLQVNGNRIRVGTAKTPASASDTGTAGEICWDSSYIYVCTATDTWKRAALSTW